MSDLSWVPIPQGSGFGLDNLPLAIGHDGDGRRRAWVAVGDDALDLEATARAGWLDGIDLEPAHFGQSSLNMLLAEGPDASLALRAHLRGMLTDARAAEHLKPAVVPRVGLRLDPPVHVGDYVDFYSSLHHATNLGRLFRPDGDPLLPNWRHLPVGYHGRAGTIVASGTDIVRPRGMRLVDGAPEYGPSRALDIELEVGSVVGSPSTIGHPVNIARAGDHLAGVVLVNDWSARDIQSFEYQPLGPFLGKSFATSVSPWLITMAALEPYRLAPPVQDPPVADYLRTDQPWGFDLHLEVWIESAAMRVAGTPPLLVTEVSFADMYWTPAQQLAHLTANGASVRTGDLFASGTVSGPTPGSEGSFIERTENGTVPLDLPDGTVRCFLHDGDRVTLRGRAGSRPEGSISLGSVSGTIVGESTTGEV